MAKKIGLKVELEPEYFGKDVDLLGLNDVKSGCFRGPSRSFIIAQNGPKFGHNWADCDFRILGIFEVVWL